MIIQILKMCFLWSLSVLLQSHLSFASSLPTQFSGMDHSQMIQFFRTQYDQDRSIDLSGSDLNDRYFESLVSYRYVCGLVKLSFAETQITSRSLRNISEFSCLRSLNLSGTRLCNDDISHLGKLNNLCALDLSKCPKLETGLFQILSKHLHDIPLRELKAAGLSKKCVLEMKNLDIGTLEVLDISGNLVTRQFFSPASNLALKRLVMDGVHIKSIDIEGVREDASYVLSLTEECTTYRHIPPNSFLWSMLSTHESDQGQYFSDAPSTEITTDSDYRLTIPRTTDIAVIDDYDRSIDNESKQSHLINRLSQFRHLTHLDISSLSLCDKHLNHLLALPLLQVLAVTNNFLTHKAFDTFKQIKTLKVLDCSRNPIADRQNESLPLPENLNTLWLSCTRIVGGCLSHIFSTSNLTELNLTQTPLNIDHLRTLLAIKRRTPLRLSLSATAKLPALLNVLDIVKKNHKVTIETIKI